MQRFIVRLVCLATVVLLSAYSPMAFSQSWNFRVKNNQTVYNWNDKDTWVAGNGFPNGAGHEAVLAASLTENVTLDLNSNLATTIGSLVLGSPTFTYTIQNSGSGALNFNNNGGISTINIQTGAADLIIAAPVTVTGGLTATNNSTTGTLQFTGASLVANNSGLIFGGVGNTTIAGAISGSVSQFRKDNAGTLRLNGANSFTTNVSVNGGTLLVNGSLSSNSAVTLVSGTTLGGTGTIPAGVNGATGAIIAPGDAGPGTLTIGGNLNLNGTGFQFEINGPGSADRLNFTGNNLNLNNAPATFTTTASDLSGISSLMVLNFTGNGSIGTFAGMPENSQIIIAGVSGGIPHTATISYVGNTGNDVVLTSFQPVPEPAHLLGLIGLGGFFWHRRRNLGTHTA